MSRHLVLISTITLGFFIISCKPDKRVDQEEVKKELKEREIRKISEAEIFAAAQKWGDTITAKSQKVLASNLKKAIQEGGSTHAIQFCNIHAIPLLDSIENAFDVNVRRVSLNVRNPKDKPDSLERIILEAYHYNQEHEEPLESNIQKVDASSVLYTKPITINNGMCLSCHGEPGKDISEETLNKIDELYPNDEARNYKFGDLRGMWSINMPIKAIINEKL